MTNQLQQAEQVDVQLRAIDAYESKKFLDEMRDIQETGKKAAEIMLKASKNMAGKGEISETISSTVPVEKSDSFDHSSSGTITSKISPRTDTIVTSSGVVQSETKYSTSNIQTDTKYSTSNLQTVESKTEIETETETDGKISESIISEKGNFDFLYIPGTINVYKNFGLT